MSVDLSFILPNSCRSLQDKEDAKKCFNDTIERIVKYFHGRKYFITEVIMNEEETDEHDLEYSFEIPALNVTANMYAGFWDIWIVANYSSYFYPFAKDMFGKPRSWPRDICFNVALAFGFKEGWICDEYHSGNSLLTEDTDTTFEDWIGYGRTAEDSILHEFNMMDFAETNYSMRIHPDYKAKYHDDFKECHAVLEAIRRRFPEYEILLMEGSLKDFALAAKDGGFYLLNVVTGKCLTDFPIDQYNDRFNGAGFQVFRGEESAFFNKYGKQLTEFRVGEFCWDWDPRPNRDCEQIIIDRASRKIYQVDGTSVDFLADCKKLRNSYWNRPNN